jgi:hypothetical protein
MEDAIAIRAGTIVTGDYLPWARTLARSFAEHHPGVPFTVAVLGDCDRAALRDDEPFECAAPADLGLDGSEYAWMAAIYDNFELSCAMKPWLLRRLIADADVAMYLDSDILVCGPLTDLARRAHSDGIVVCPHLLEPPPDDGRFPNEDTILQSGQLNGGFVAIGRESPDFLEWWQRRLRRECRAFGAQNPQRFVDQRWLDLAVNYFDITPVRDRGANVAYWNLATRRLVHDGDRYRVDGEPLLFMHFSGFDPARPEVLSKHLGPHPRIQPSQNPALARLCAEYCERLALAGLSSGGQVAPAPILADGLPLTGPVRQALRAALIQAEATDGAAVPDARDPSALIGWLATPVTGGGVSRYLAALRAATTALADAFPRVPGADEPRYLAWAAAEGVARGLVPRALAPEDGSASQTPEPPLVATSALDAPLERVVEVVLGFAASGGKDRLAVAVSAQEATTLAEQITTAACGCGIALEADIVLVQCGGDDDLVELLRRAYRHIDSGCPRLRAAVRAHDELKTLIA